MEAPPTIDPALARELAALIADSAQLMLAAKKLTSTLMHGGGRDTAAITQHLQATICQTGYLMDECARRLGATPVYSSADGWTLPMHITDHQ